MALALRKRRRNRDQNQGLSRVQGTDGLKGSFASGYSGFVAHFCIDKLFKLLKRVKTIASEKCFQNYSENQIKIIH